MHRAAHALLTPALLLGCAGRGAPPAASPAAASDACADDPSPPAVSARLTEPPWGSRITRIQIAGAARVPPSMLRASLRSHVGDRLDPTRVAEDIAGLDSLEVLDGISVEADRSADGVALRFVVAERHPVASVRFEGLAQPVRGRWLALAPGEIFDRPRLARSARGLQAQLFDSGHRQARVEGRSHVLPSGEVAVCYRVRPGPRYLVGRIAFNGNDAVETPELTALIDTHDGHVNQHGQPLREDLMQVDLLRVTALYYDKGYVAVHVDGPRVSLDAQHARADVQIDVDEGAQYRLGKLAVAGDATIPKSQQLRLLGVRSGEIFNRSKLARGIEVLQDEYRRRGRPMRVTPDTALDAKQARVDLTFRVEREP